MDKMLQLTICAVRLLCHKNVVALNRKIPLSIKFGIEDDTRKTES